MVEVDGIEACAIGTAFAVGRGPEGVQITVTEGVVKVVHGATIVRVSAGGRAMVPNSGEMLVSALDDEQLDRDLAWRDGRVVLSGEPLEEALARFNRFNKLQLSATDPALLREPVVGSFNLYEPEAFADAVAAVFSTSVARNAGGISIGPAPPQNNL